MYRDWNPTPDVMLITSGTIVARNRMSDTILYGPVTEKSSYTCTAENVLGNISVAIENVAETVSRQPYETSYRDHSNPCITFQSKPTEGYTQGKTELERLTIFILTTFGSFVVCFFAISAVKYKLYGYF